MSLDGYEIISESTFEYVGEHHNINIDDDLRNIDIAKESKWLGHSKRSILRWSKKKRLEREAFKNSQVRMRLLKGELIYVRPTLIATPAEFEGDAV